MHFNISSNKSNTIFVAAMMKRPLKIIFFLILLTSALKVKSQNKILDKIFSEDTTRHNSFLPIPVIGYAQEAGFEFGAAAIYSFYLHKDDPLIRASNLYSAAIFSTKKQSSVRLKADIWSRENKYHYIGDIRYNNNTFNFYGIGNDTRRADEDPLILKRFRLTGEFEKSFGRSLYFGANTLFEKNNFEDIQPGGIYQTNNLIFDKDGGKVLYMGLSTTIDSRNNIIYTTKGTLLRLNLNFAPDFFKGENFTGTLFKADFRNFQKINEELVIGLHGVYESLNGRSVSPFYLLPQLGNDNIMRGYYLGRYRANNLMAAQTEIRYRFNPHVGVIGFIGTGMVYNSGNFRTGNLKPNYGIGARYFFDIEKGLSLRLDYGIGEKPAGEKRISGFYISLSEAF